MNRRTRLWIVASVAFLSLAGSADVYAQQSETTFFVTSAGSGKGADLGGLAGADQHCQTSRRRPAPAARPGTRI